MGNEVEIVLPEKGGAGVTSSVSRSPFLNFERQLKDNEETNFTFPKKTKKWRKKAEKDPILQSLQRSPFLDPEEEEASNWR